MNEGIQLKAMAAELTAAGYNVLTDVRGGQLETRTVGTLTKLEGIELDIVAELVQLNERNDEKVSFLVVEIANRRRRPEGRYRLARPLPRYVEDDEALKRFEIISAALADVPQAELQIRFFDVSADQAAARQLKGSLKAKDAMLERLMEDWSMLARSAGREDLSHALVVTRLWSHWLRIVGNLHPGRDRRELKNADLRTIQKDLFDQQIIDMKPSRYATIHQTLLAVFEGGEINLDDLIELQPQVRRLLDWAVERYGVSTRAEPKPDSLVDRIRIEIAERAVGSRRRELETGVMLLGFLQNGRAFPQAVISFMLALGSERIVSEDLITELLEQAASSSF